MEQGKDSHGGGAVAQAMTDDVESYCAENCGEDLTMHKIESLIATFACSLAVLQIKPNKMSHFSSKSLLQPNC